MRNLKIFANIRKTLTKLEHLYYNKVVIFTTLGRRFLSDAVSLASFASDIKMLSGIFVDKGIFIPMVYIGKAYNYSPRSNISPSHLVY
jgi:hypothetical protein